MSRYATAAMAVQIIDMVGLPPINQARIRKWAERGKVRRGGLDQFGFMRYNLDDIVQASQEGASDAAKVST